MARLIANVDILTETFGSWVTRTNDVIDALATEVLTANTTAGVTGSISVPRTAVLHGTLKSNNAFLSNTITIGTNLIANTTALALGTGVKVLANNSFGTLGQILATSGSGVYWTTVSGTGTVTSITAGSGLNPATITNFGTLSVKPGTGIIVDASGVSVNAAYISTFTSGSATLEGYTWASPARIGSTTANTGAFTTLSSSSYTIPGDGAFLINNTTIRTQGNIDATTPATGTTGGVRLRGRSGGPAYLQVTDVLGSTTWGTATILSTGNWSWSGSFTAGGALSATSLSATSLNITDGTTLNSLNVTTGTFNNLSVTGVLSLASISTTGNITSTAGNISGVRGIFSGAVSGTTGTFSSTVSGAAGSFSGAVSGTTGTFSSTVSGAAGTFTGTVSGVAGSFSGAVSGTTGTFSSTVSGVAGSFSGAVSGTTGTFTGAVTSGGSALLKLTDFTQSKASSGYTKLPNGIVIQWGPVPSTSGETTSSVTFPLAFSAAYSVVATSINSSNDSENDFWLQVSSFGITGATFYHNSSDGGSESSPGYYIAIGNVI